MKPAVTLGFLMFAVLYGIADQTNVHCDATCTALSQEYRVAFEHTTFWGSKAFVAHAAISSNEIASIKDFFLMGKTTPGEALTWFGQQSLPVATHAYHGCVKGYTYTSFMHKVDADSWLVFLFSGNTDGLQPFLRGERLSSVYLVRKEKQRRWIEEIVSANTNHNATLFRDGMNEGLLKDVDVKIETDL